MLKSNVIAAAIVGLVLGVIAEFFLAWAGQVPVLGCLLSPVALLVDLALPILIGALAAAWGASRGLLTTPSGVVDGALAAVLAELTSRLVSFCASLVTARSFFPGPRVLVPTVGPAAYAFFAGVWGLGWLVISLIVAALLGALGAVLYRAMLKK